MRNLLIFTAFFCCTLFSKEYTFKDFTEGNYFAPIDDSYLQLKAVCRKNYDEKDRKKYFEIMFFSNEKHVFDLNQHFMAFQTGYKNLKKPFYTFTVWNWFESIAIKSSQTEFMSNTPQLDRRRSELVPENLVEEMLTSGEFTIFFHYLMDNTKSKGQFRIINLGVVKSCFE